MKKYSAHVQPDDGGRGRSGCGPIGAVMGVVLLSGLLCACNSVTFDARQFSQPMVLNNNAFLGPTNAAFLVSTNVDHYAATTKYEEHSWLTSKQEQQETHHTLVNEAQANAFKKIGGQTNRFIRNVMLEAVAAHAYTPFFMGLSTRVEVGGDVAEFHAAPDTNAPALIGGTQP